MTTRIPFVPFALTVCGIQELAGHCEANVSHVLSILDPDWPVPEAFGAFGEHEKLELRFNDIIDEQPNQIAPSRRDVETLLRFGRDLLAEPASSAHLLVHCHAGVSRSTAAMTLLLAQARPERPAEEAVAEVVRIRPIAWPNLRMIEFGDALLGRDGALIEAAHRRYREVVARDPGWGYDMVRGGRGREAAPALGL